MSFETEWAAFDFDLACLYLGRQAEKDAADGEKSSTSSSSMQSGSGFASLKNLAKRTIKVKENGTW